MDDLTAAREQLEKAVARLEAALAARTKATAGDPATAKALDAARADYRRLREAADTVSARLDATIGRLRATLSGDVAPGRDRL